MEPRGFPVRNRLRLLENRNMLIGLTQLPDKLVFVGMRPKLPVIANQSA